ncbi:MAG: FGGY-family carbohydrate kinase [Synechococcus sp.]|nr:FGGY-family carbohydrate kinase [Synechococcus sp.]
MTDSEPLGLGIDLGTSGLRVSVVNTSGEALQEEAIPYPGEFRHADSWRQGLIALMGQVAPALKSRIAALAIDGTSGTLLACDQHGAPLGQALAYCDACPNQAAQAKALIGGEGAAASASGSVARALELLEQLKWPESNTTLPLLRHQADWLMGWLLGHWRWGEEGNNLRLGWELERQCWSGELSGAPWARALPEIVASGQALGSLQPQVAAQLELGSHCQVVSGTTDGNASVLAADPAPGDGVAVLGTTLVLKQFHNAPLQGAGINNHRLAGRWLVGGASNAGAGVLRRFFSDQQLQELSRQIDPRQPSGLQLRPLPQRGERFPIDDPTLEPVLEPRPVSDALFLQGLLEGLCELERLGWQRLQQLGTPPIQRVLSVGGGARNPQWRQLRRQALGLPVLDRSGTSAATAMARLALRGITLAPTSAETR